jgi:NAD(P)-dependent dehydrogenase (short-subunit alcohol dehydrogenase family)
MSVSLNLDSQIAWVTGAASGIGRATVERLADAGARVVALDISTAVHAIVREGVEALELDVRRPEAIAATVGMLAERGLEPDVLVNAAGINRDAVVWKLSDEAWDSVVDVNLSGAFRMTRAVAPLMRGRGRGVIVNIASINGLRGKVGLANYAASKGGLIAMTRTVARELGRFGVRVNAIAPGFIDTPMTQAVSDEIRAAAVAETTLGRMGTPIDVANAVLFLASPLAAHITGHVLVVDGGQTA